MAAAKRLTHIVTKLLLMISVWKEWLLILLASHPLFEKEFRNPPVMPIGGRQFGARDRTPPRMRTIWFHHREAKLSTPLLIREYVRIPDAAMNSQRREAGGNRYRVDPIRGNLIERSVKAFPRQNQIPPHVPFGVEIPNEAVTTELEEGNWLPRRILSSHSDVEGRSLSGICPRDVHTVLPANADLFGKHPGPVGLNRSLSGLLSRLSGTCSGLRGILGSVRRIELGKQFD
jgi:hypothetical protein